MRVWLGLLVLLCGAACAQTAVVDPRSPTDLITQINTLEAGCAAGCTIRIPAGEYTVQSGTVLLHRNNISLEGDGRNNTIIHYAGLNFLDARLADPDYSRSFRGGSTVGGFTVICSNPRAHCITAGSEIGQIWHGLTVEGPAGLATVTDSPGSSEGFTLQNDNHWMERTVFRDINLGGFSTNFRFMAPKAGGTDSFGYMLFDGLWTSLGPGTRDFVVDAGAAVYNVLGFSMQFNSQKTSPRDEVFAIAGQFTGVGFHVTGENAGAPLTFAHVACGGRMSFEGDFNVFGGGLLADCPQANDQRTPPFRVTPTAGLGGVRYSMDGLPVAPAATALGLIPAQPLSLWAYQTFQSENPTAGSFNGYAGTKDGRFSPLTVFDPALPWCLATRGDYLQPSSLVYRLCVGGRGDLVAAGSVKGTSVQTTRGTPASSREACTPGESWDDDNFHYHCTSAGQIKRLALQPF